MFVQLYTYLCEYDAAWLIWLNHHRIPYSVKALQFLSDATTYTSIGMIMVCLIAAAVKRSGSLWKKALSLTIAITIVALTTQGIKSIVQRERPFKKIPAIEKLSTGGDASFPSGHTTEAFAMAAALSLLFRKKEIMIPVYIWAFLVAYSRMALGVHYPSDVLFGAALGTLISWLVVASLRNSSLFRKENLQRQKD
jgi:membrane-associated phospholipid phosphatase